MSRRLLLTGAVICTVLGSVLTAFVGDFSVLPALRALTGLIGEGPLYAIGVAVLGDDENPDRAFALTTAVQVSYGSVALWLLPSLLARWQFPGLALALAFMAAAVLPLVRQIDPHSTKRTPERGGAVRGPGRLVFVALTAHMLFYAGVGAVWAFLERIGSASGLDAASIGRSLAIATGLSLIGAGVASWLAGRVRRAWPFTMTLVGMSIALLLLADRPTALAFAVAAGLFSLFCNMAGPAQLGAVAELDVTGRMVALGPGFQAAGVAIGPALVGMMLSGGGYVAVSVVGAVMIGSSICAFLVLDQRMVAAPSVRRVNEGVE